MDENKFNLVFSGSSNGRINTKMKQIPAKFLYSDISWGFECSPGDRPAEPIMPNRYAPIVKEIRNKSLFEKGIVIPYGTIISALPVMNKEYYSSGAGPDNLGAASGDTSSGNLALGIGYDGSLIQDDLNDMIDGYDRIKLIATIANGGEDATDLYTSKDTDRNRVGLDGSLVEAGDAFTRGKNIPFGFVTEDIYLFESGNRINFNEVSYNKFSTFATDYFVEMPYVVNDSYNVGDGGNYDGDDSASDVYKAIKNLGMPFLWAESASDLINGAFVQPDMNGKWRMQYSGKASAVSGNKTAQTTGKLISFTNKYPKDLENFVETWNNADASNYGKNYSGATSTGGTATYGLPYKLFVMICTILSADSTEISYSNIKDFLNSGEVGIARINVHTS